MCHRKLHLATRVSERVHFWLHLPPAPALTGVIGASDIDSNFSFVLSSEIQLKPRHSIRAINYIDGMLKLSLRRQISSTEGKKTRRDAKIFAVGWGFLCSAGSIIFFIERWFNVSLTSSQPTLLWLPSEESFLFRITTTSSRMGILKWDPRLETNEQKRRTFIKQITSQIHFQSARVYDPTTKSWLRMFPSHPAEA